MPSIGRKITSNLEQQFIRYLTLNFNKFRETKDRSTIQLLCSVQQKFLNFMQFHLFVFPKPVRLNQLFQKDIQH